MIADNLTAQMKQNTETLLVVAAIALGIIVGWFVSTMDARANAVKQTCGYYDIRTGEFRWGQP